MKLLIATAMVFFGTLIAAALVALAAPATVDRVPHKAQPVGQSAAPVLASFTRDRATWEGLRPDR